jgi:hypothetical protein
MYEPIHIEVRQLRDQISHNAYRVDSQAVADAIVRRRWAVSFNAQRPQPRVSAIAARGLGHTAQAIAA